MMTDTCIGALNEAARVEVKEDTRHMLKSAALLLREAVERLCVEASLENMINLNGVWAYSARVLKLATPQVDPNPPQAGAGQPPLPGYLTNQRRAA
jgi:hypothetical protein